MTLRRIIYNEIETGTENENGRYVTFSVDEKPGIQALKNVRPEIMPLQKKNKYRLIDPEYKRMGTVNFKRIVAGVNLSDRHVTGKVYTRNRSLEFVNFLKHLNEEICR